MASSVPHIHISALDGFKVWLYVIIGLGIMHVAARHFQGHPFFDMLMSVFC